MTTSPIFLRELAKALDFGVGVVGLAPRHCLGASQMQVDRLRDLVDRGVEFLNGDGDSERVGSKPLPRLPGGTAMVNATASSMAPPTGPRRGCAVRWRPRRSVVDDAAGAGLEPPCASACMALRPSASDCVRCSSCAIREAAGFFTEALAERFQRGGHGADFVTAIFAPGTTTSAIARSHGAHSTIKREDLSGEAAANPCGDQAREQDERQWRRPAGHSVDSRERLA